MARNALLIDADYGSFELPQDSYTLRQSWMLGHELQAAEFQNYIMEEIYRFYQGQRSCLSQYGLWRVLGDAPSGSTLREFYLDFWSTHCLSPDHIFPNKRSFHDLLIDFEDVREVGLERSWRRLREDLSRASTIT